MYLFDLKMKKTLYMDRGKSLLIKCLKLIDFHYETIILRYGKIYDGK